MLGLPIFVIHCRY